MTDLQTQKALARKAAFARRKTAHLSGKTGRAGRLSELLAGYRGVPIAGYLPIQTEINPLPAMEEACAYGPVGVPVVTGEAKPLRFARWEPGVALTANAFGTQVPQDLRFMVPEILIIPLVAFDLNGARLGYGGGFYDRTLAELRAKGPVLAVGLAYAAQQTTSLPVENTDQPLDLIVTEAAIHSL